MKTSVSSEFFAMAESLRFFAVILLQKLSIAVLTNSMMYTIRSSLFRKMKGNDEKGGIVINYKNFSR